MSRETAERFARALQETEQRRDPDPVCALFTDDGEAASLALRNPARGRDAVRRFWQHYLDNFDDVASEFTRIVATDDAVALEWISRGHLRGGREVTYRGVSVLELDGGRVRRFRTYFDPGPFVSAGRKLASAR